MNDQEYTSFSKAEVKVRTTILLTGLIVILLIVAGCEGPEGPEGIGLDQDLIPPEITLITPAPGDTIKTPTVWFEAIATDNDSVKSVEFFLDGSSDLGQDSSAIVKVPEADSITFRFPWIMDPDTWAVGQHVLCAEAVDLNENYKMTPPMPVYYLPLYGERVLAYHLDGEYSEPLAVALPDGYGDRYYNVRFSPHRECELKEVQFRFEQYDEVGIDIFVYTWESDDRLPGTCIDSFLVQQDNLNYTGWTVLDMSDRGLPLFSDDFHVGWSPDPSQYDQYLADERGLSIYAAVCDTALYRDPLDNHSSEYEASDRGWGTLQDHWLRKLDLYIQAVVDYGDGEETLLIPGPEMIISEKSALPKELHKR